MSKYEILWNWIREHQSKDFKMTFKEIEEITGFSIDHSFLTYKKELMEYGYKVLKISMKEKIVFFGKI